MSGNLVNVKFTFANFLNIFTLSEPDL